ncbi:MAG: 50S ribosomal protein L11 methyltransferase [Planctomycetales bacterium]
MYSLFDYGGMINRANSMRTEAFTQALQRAITPASVVLDIGTGAGYFALVAARFGARHVYAIEPNPIIQVGQEAAIANALDDRITFLQAKSTDVTLPEQADIIISDIGGALPLCGPLIEALEDARQRLQVPGGKMIPQADMLCATVVQSPRAYSQLVDPWDHNPAGLDLSAIRQRVTSLVRKQPFKAKHAMTDHQCWATVDYYQSADPNYAGHLKWQQNEGGTGHGLALWFDRAVDEQCTFSNAPAEPVANPIYSNLYMPWSEPIELDVDDVIDVKLRADLVKKQYVWSWKTTVTTAGGECKARFAQSSFMSRPIGLTNSEPLSIAKAA